MKQAEKSFDGAVSHAKQIGDIKKDGVFVVKHSDYKKACDSCIDVLTDFNISEFKIK